MRRLMRRTPNTPTRSAKIRFVANESMEDPSTLRVLCPLAFHSHPLRESTSVLSVMTRSASLRSSVVFVSER